MSAASNKNCLLGLLLCSKVKQLKLRHIPHTLTPSGSLESPVSLMFRIWRKSIQAPGENIKKKKAQNQASNTEFPIKLGSAGFCWGFRALLVPGTGLVHARLSRTGDVIRLVTSSGRWLARGWWRTRSQGPNLEFGAASPWQPHPRRAQR